MSEWTLPSGFCNLGRQLQTDLQSHAQAVAEANRQITLHHQSQDTNGRQLPRALHENLSTANNRRDLGQMQWTRHIAKCDQCRTAQAASADKQQQVA